MIRQDFVSKFHRITGVNLVILFLLSVGVIIGWIFDVCILKGGLEGSVSVNPITAISFILSGLSLVLLVHGTRPLKMCGKIIASLILLVGIVRLAEIGFNLDTGISETLFADKLLKERVYNSMAPNTASCFVITGLALLFFSSISKVRTITSDFFSVVVFLVALFSVVGYLYSAPEFYNIRSYIPMAFSTAVCFFLLSSATLFQTSQLGIFHIFRCQMEGCKMARFLIPFAVLIPIVLGKIRIYGEGASLYSSAFGTAFFTMTTVFLLIFLIWRSAIMINIAGKRLSRQIEMTKEVSEALYMEQRKDFERKLMNDKIIRHKELIAATINGQEKEKKQIGMELHDHINQILASTKMYLEASRTDVDMRDSLIEKSKEQLAFAMNEIRNLSKSMVLHSAEDGGIYEQIDEMCDNIHKASQINVINNICALLLNKLHTKAQIAVYRIIEEQLNNILKYARCKTIHIYLGQQDDEVVLNIRDDGNGFDTATIRRGIGLSNISSRADLLDGTMTVVSAPGQGCSLEVRFPVEQA